MGLIENWKFNFIQIATNESLYLGANDRNEN